MTEKERVVIRELLSRQKDWKELAREESRKREKGSM